MEEMMITTTTFIRGEAAAASKKTGRASWKPQDQSKRHSSDKRPDFQGHPRGKGGLTDLQLLPRRRKKSWLPKQVEELVRAGKLSHLIKEIKQGRDQSKTGKKERTAKDKPTAIYMVQSWQRIVKQKVTQSFERVREIAFPQLTTSNGTEGPLVIEAEMGGHVIYRMYIDGGSSMKILYEHCFNQLRPEIKSQMVPVTTSLTGFSDETIWPLGQLRLLEVVIGGSLSDKGRTELCSVLKKNLDIFAWQPSDMTGVPQSVVEHQLNIRDRYTPVRQKKRGQAPERARAIQAEVQKLVDARIMREVYYHDWLSNPVMVKKHDGSWRMCVNFTDLNRAYAYKGYHQIQLAEADEEKTTFHTGQGVYCYTKMPFSLKNAGATYQRLMDKAFESQVGRNIEVYVDDLVVKTQTKAEMVRDIEETFRTLRKVNMKLNPKKCSFELAEGVFLGYVITPEGIKPCPDKIVAVLQLPSPQTVKEVHSLNGKLASLNRSGASVPAAEAAFRGPDDEKENNSNADLLHKSRAIGSGAKLFANGEIGLVTSLCIKEAPTFAASNNEAEYEAPVAGLWIATQMGVKNIQVNVDSKLVANQVLGTYVAKEDNMIKYLEIVKGLVSGFTTFSISQVPRSKNKQADALSKIALTSFAHFSKQVLVEVLENKSIKENEVAAVIEEDGPTWMTQIADYLKEGVLPGDNKEARKLRLKARQYELMKGVLYRRLFLTPWLRCVGPLQADYIMREIHKGSCSMHAGPRSVVGKAIRLWYYWLTMHKDAHDMIRKCNDCQIHRPITRPLFKRAGEGQVPDSHNGLLHEVDWCDKLNIAQRFASVKHPQSNGLIKRANQSLGEGIKARLGEGNKNWIEELPHVLWAYRTMVKSSHGDMPFSLTYGTEAVIPVEIEMPTYCTTAVDVVNNDKELRINLDLLEERQERAAVCEARAKSKMMKYYNVRVRGVAFKLGDFVYRSNDASHAVAGKKLGPKWEGPCEVNRGVG
nr:reverse transcriptase domain-containing protein [Tanacetum cinerariifolium]